MISKKDYNFIHEANVEYCRLRHKIPLGVLHSEKEYRKAVAVLDEILDEIGENENHPLADMAEALSVFIEDYEDAHAPMLGSSIPGIIKHLMDEHSLKQSDLPEIGSQGVISEILSGKRELNVRQISLLAKRFSVSPAVFIRNSHNPHPDPAPSRGRE